MKTLSSNVSTGISATFGKPVLLLQLTNGVTTFRFGQKDTNTFASWTGDRFYGGVIQKKGIGDFRQEVNIPSGSSLSNLASLDVTLINPEYTAAPLRFDEYLAANGISLRGFVSELRLVYDASGASWANAAKRFYGIVDSFEFDLEVYVLHLRDITESAFPMVPRTLVNEHNFPDVNANDLGNPESIGLPVGIVFGQPPMVRCHLTDATASAQIVTVETETVFDAGTLGVSISDTFFEVNPYRLTAGTGNKRIEFDSDAPSTDASLVPFWTDLLMAESWSSGFSVTNTANAFDGSLSTYATGVLNDTHDETDYKKFANIGSDAVEALFGKFPMISVYTYAKIESSSATALGGGTSYDDRITLLGASGGWDTSRDGQFPYSGTAYNSISGADDPARARVSQSDLDNPPTVESVLRNGLSFAPGDRSAPTSITAKLYEFKFRLEVSQPFNVSELWTSEMIGRTFGSSSGFTGGGRYSSAASTAAISSPAAAVEHLLRYELLDAASVDVTSFNACFTALNAWGYTSASNYGGCTNTWTLDGVFQDSDQKNLFSVIGDLCKSFGMAYVRGYDGTHKLHMVEVGSTADATATLATLRRGGIRRRKSPSSKDIKNKFTIKYGYDARLDRYTKTLVVSQDMGLYPGQPFRYLQLECAASVVECGGDTYEMTVSSDWIREDADAYKLADWLVWRYCRGLEGWEAVTRGLEHEALELMDTLKVQHPLVGVSPGLDFLVYGIIGHSNDFCHTFKLARRPVALSRANGAPSLMQRSSAIPVGLWGLRRLKDAYSGPAIQVRRSTDSATQDIGFTDEGDLDTVALLAFCGAGSGYVAKVYDQTGNGNTAAQGTTSYQPSVVSAGALVTGPNGKAAISFGGTHYLSIPAVTWSSNSALSVLAVANQTGASDNQYLVCQYNTSAAEYTFALFYYYDRVRYVVTSNGAVPGAANAKSWRGDTVLAGTWNCLFSRFESGTHEIFVDGTEDTPYSKIYDAAITAFFNTGTSALTIGCSNNGGSGTNRFTGYVCEIAVFNAEVTPTDQAAMEESVATYYAL